MTFREMIENYRKGTLTPEQMQMVESEIEKHEAISEYLYDDTDIPGLDSPLADAAESGSGHAEEAERFTSMINSSIRKAFIRMGIIVASVTLAVTLAVIFVLPGAVSAFYYNPNEVVGVSQYGFETTRLDLDLSVFTELFLPTRYRNEAISEAEGYGVYNISIPQITSANGTYTTITGVIKRDNIMLYNPDLLRYPTGNAFVIDEEDYYMANMPGPAGSPADARRALDELDDSAYYTAYVTFDKLTSYEDFLSWYKPYDEACFNLWCGVYTGNTSPDLMGFCPELSGKCLDWDREAYPKLCLLDNSGSVEQKESDESDPEVMKTHFISMLRYMKDNRKTMELFCLNEVNWNDVIGYVDENGLQLFGAAVTADKECIIAMADDPAVSYVYTTPAM